jgi:uncharacterized protein (DUF427 family)
MSLTIGTGPFGQHPAGRFNFELPKRQGLLYLEEFPRRMRGILGGETVVDSRNAKLLHEHGHLPILYFPEEEVRMELLEPSDHHTRCPWKGEASYWTVRADGKSAENAAWYYPEPMEGAPSLTGLVSFYWHTMDEWLEEDEPAIGHVRDPYHRVDVVDTSRHVRVLVDGEVVADSRRTRALFETGLPTRWYFPAEDVREEALVESDTRTICAYKGEASYWAIRSGESVQDDLAWFYPEPRHDAEHVRGYIAFFNERLDIEVDGELEERPQTQWSQKGGGRS